jgi:hypothetical protein
MCKETLRCRVPAERDESADTAIVVDNAGIRKWLVVLR